MRAPTYTSPYLLIYTCEFVTQHLLLCDYALFFLCKHRLEMKKKNQKNVVQYCYEVTQFCSSSSPLSSSTVLNTSVYLLIFSLTTFRYTTFVQTHIHMCIHIRLHFHDAYVLCMLLNLTGLLISSY